MSLNINTISAKNIRAVQDRVLVTDMYFGEQKTSAGIIIGNDDGTTRGVYPRWGKVYTKGPGNTDEYDVGDWILVEHGRWTRGIKMEISGEEMEIRMVEAESVLAVSKEKPQEVQIGNEYSDGQGVDIRPEDFGAN